MKYTSIDRIFTKVHRDLPAKDIEETDIIEWTGEALDFINAIRATEEAVAFLKVRNFQTEVPHNLHSIIQIAKNTKVESVDQEAVVSDNDEVLEEPDSVYPVCLDESGMPYNSYEVAYYRPYYDLQYEYSAWMQSVSYNRCYVPVRLTDHSFFNSIVCSQQGSDCTNYSEEDTEGLYHQWTYEYTVVEGTMLRFNFQEGLVAVAYNRTVLDKDGLPKIPDDISFTTAIISYITYRLMMREFIEGKQGSQSRMEKAEDNWQWYCKQSSNKSLLPKGVDEMENLMNQRSYIIPRMNAYSNFFGNLNNKEVKNIMHTQLRNNNYYGREAKY